MKPATGSWLGDASAYITILTAAVPMGSLFFGFVCDPRVVALSVGFSGGVLFATINKPFRQRLIVLFGLKEDSEHKRARSAVWQNFRLLKPQAARNGVPQGSIVSSVSHPSGAATTGSPMVNPPAKVPVVDSACQPGLGVGYEWPAALKWRAIAVPMRGPHSEDQSPNPSFSSKPAGGETLGTYPLPLRRSVRRLERVTPTALKADDAITRLPESDDLELQKEIAFLLGRGR